MSLQVPNEKIRIELQRGKDCYIGEVTPQELVVQQLKLEFPLQQLKMQDCQINAGKQLFTVKKEVRDYIFDVINLFKQGNRIPTSTKLFSVNDLMEGRRVEIAAIPGFFVIKMVQSDTYYRANASLLAAAYHGLRLRVQTKTAVLGVFEFENEKDIADFAELLRSINIKTVDAEISQAVAQATPKFSCGFTRYYKQAKDKNFIEVTPYDEFIDIDVAIGGDRLILSEEDKELTGCQLESIWCINFFDCTVQLESDDQDGQKVEEDTFVAEIKLCDNTRFLLLFETQLSRELFAEYVLDCLTQRFIAPQLQFYEYSPEFSIDLPFSPCSGKLIQQLFETFSTTNRDIQIALLVENDARTIPVTTKRVELLKMLLEHIEQTDNSAIIAASFDLLRRLVTSRTLFISAVRDHLSWVHSVLKRHVGNFSKSDPTKSADGERVIVSALLFLRSILSYEWDPEASGPGKSVSGVFQAYSVGIFSQIYLDLLQKPVKQYFRCELELEAFSSLGVDETERFKASIGLHTIFEQGKNYVASRQSAELNNRIQLIEEETQVLPLLGGYIAHLNQVSLPLVQTAILGILEDIIITKSQIERQPSQVSASQQPAGRSALFTLVYECYAVFVTYSACSVRGLRICSSLLLYNILIEDVLPKTFKEEISEHFLTSGAVLAHMRTLLDDGGDFETKEVSLALLGVLYSNNKNVQNLFRKVFPTSMLSGCRCSAGGFDYEHFRSLRQHGVLWGLEKRVLECKSDLRIVWDQNIIQYIIQQIDNYQDSFAANCSITESVALNYERLVIKHSGASLGRHARFDVDVGGFFLSQFLCPPAGITVAFESANTIPSVSGATDNAAGVSTAIIENAVAVIECIGDDLSSFYTAKKPVPAYHELAEKLQKENAVEIVDLFYRAYGQIPHNKQIKAALIYAIHSIMIACGAQFDFVGELATEVTVELQQESYQLAFYLISLLECVGYRQNPKDMLKRQYFNMLSEHFVLEFIVYRVFPLICFEQGKIAADAPLGEDLDLIRNQTFGNLIFTAMRFVHCCILQQSSKDYDGNILYPEPTVYELLSEPEVLDILLALFVVCDRAYEQSKLQIAEAIVIEELKLLTELVREITTVSNKLLSEGYIEALLANQFSESVNREAFELIKLVQLHAEDGDTVMRKELPAPVCAYISKYEAASIACVFCSQRYLSLNIIWTANARQNLENELRQFENRIFEQLSALTLQEMVYGRYQNPLVIASYEEGLDKFAFWRFETVGDHPKIVLDDELQRYEAHRSGDVYLQLINVENFLAVQELMEYSLSGDLVAEHEEMLEKFEDGITLEQCMEYLKATLEIDVFEAILEDGFVFKSLLNYRAEYIHTIVLLLLRASEERFAELVSNVRDFEKQEQMIREALEQYIKNTGGSGKSVLKSKHLADPEQIEARRKLLIGVYLKMLIIVFKSTKTATRVLKSLPEEFDNYCTLQHILDLSQFLEQHQYSAQFKQLSSFIPDASTENCEKATSYAQEIEKAQAELRQAVIDLLPMYLSDIVQNHTKQCLNASFLKVTTLTQEYAHVEMFSTDLVIERLEALFSVYKCDGIEENKQFVAYTNGALLLVEVLSRYSSYGRTVIESRILAYLFIYMLEGNQVAARSLSALRENVEDIPEISAAFIASLSYLGHALKTSSDGTALYAAATENVHTEQFVYTERIRDELMRFMWDEACGDTNQCVVFNEMQFLPNELKIGKFYVASMLGLFLRQFGETVEPDSFSLPNFSEDAKMQANPSEICDVLAEFLSGFFRRRFVSTGENSQTGGEALENVAGSAGITKKGAVTAEMIFANREDALRQLADGDCTVLIAVCSILLAACISQEYILEYISQRDSVVAVLLVLSTGGADSQQQECLAELASLMVAFIGGRNKLVHENARYFISLATGNTPIQRGLSSASFPDADNLKTIFVEAQSALCDCVEQFASFKYAFLDRKCYAQLVLSLILQEAEIPHLSVVELMIFMRNTPEFSGPIQFPVDENDDEQNAEAEAYQSTQYMLKSSAKMLEMLAPNDLFLQNMLQLPILLSFVKGVPAETCDLLRKDAKFPNFVWNEQCSHDLLQFLDQLFENQVFPAIMTHENVNLAPYVFEEHTAYIRDTYTSQGFYLSHVFLNVYNESCLKKDTFLANSSEFVTSIMHHFVSELANADNASLFLLYLQALTNFVTEQVEFIPSIVQNANFERLIMMLFVENQYMNLLPYQISQQVLKLVGQLLENILRVLADFPLSKQAFHDLVVVFFSSMPSVNFTLDQPVEQPTFSLQTSEKALISLSAFITILLQNPALRIDFCGMQIGRVQGEPVMAPLLSYELIVQEGIPRFIKISQLCAISQLFERSVDFTSIFRQRYAPTLYKEFVTAVLACEVGFKTPINGGAKESLDENVPVPDCEIYREWSAATPAKTQTDGFDLQDCENCLRGFSDCRRVCKSSGGLINGIPRQQINIEISDSRRLFCIRSAQLAASQLASSVGWTDKYINLCQIGNYE